MNRSYLTRMKVRAKTGYTLLELMLALALLGALMTVAWSLMGTFRDAEQRGWKLSHRVQTIRTAREWLQSDMQHLLPNEHTATANAAKSRLSGNSLGFKASIAPSLDPLPFLEELMSNPLDGKPSIEESEPAASLYSDTEAIVAQSQQSPWPAETMEIEYQLAPIEESSTGSESISLQPADLGTIQFSLTRRELLDANAIQENQSSGSRPSQPNALSERVLTAQDLYRQTDDTTQSSGVVIRETQLHGLTNVQFQYFDGLIWKQEWNSDQAGGLPRAIALCFDFPARADMKPAEPQSSNSLSDANSINDDSLLESGRTGTKTSFANSALAAVPTIESQSNNDSTLMQTATHEVQIVVYVGGRSDSKGIPNARVGGGFE